MEVAKASGASVPVRGFARRDWHFPLLTVKDLGELQCMVPVRGDRAFATIFEIVEWARTVEGCREVLLRSLRKREQTAEITPDEVDKLGSVTQRSRIATLIASESLLNGEEDTGGSKKEPRGTATG